MAGQKEDGDDALEGAQLLPVGERAEVAYVLARVLPGLDLSRIQMHPAPERAKWLRPIGWRYLAYGADDQVLVTTRGWVSRRTSIVLHHKTQSVRLEQGPLQRRLGLANVHVDTPTRSDRRHRAAPRPGGGGGARGGSGGQGARGPPYGGAASVAVQTQPNPPSPDGSSNSAASPADDSSAR